jgi:hypothetical protein
MYQGMRERNQEHNPKRRGAHQPAGLSKSMEPAVSFTLVSHRVSGEVNKAAQAL